MKRKDSNSRIFLEDLPKKIYRGRYCFDWKKSIGIYVRFVYEEIKGYILITNYNIDKQLLEIEYNDKKYNMLTGSFLKCSFGEILNKITSEFKLDIGTTFKDDKRYITITDREYRIKNKSNGRIQNEKWYKYTCNKCGWTEGWIWEPNLFKGQGCPVCCSSPQIVVEGINDIPTTAPWMIKYFQGGYDEAKLYTCQSNKKVYPICPDCGKIKSKKIIINTIYANNSISCHCGDGISYPNKFMFSILTQLKLHFIAEYSPEWIGRKYYDFYIPSLNLIIEMDGGLGHGNEVHSKSKMSKEESLNIDIYKDKMAKDNGIDVIRIDCNYSSSYRNAHKSIKENIINSELNNLQDLSIVCWDKVQEFALGNRVKEVCNSWNTGIYDTIKALSEELKLSNSTIMKFLALGNELGWCNYENQINKKQRIKQEIIDYYNTTELGASVIAKLFNVDSSTVRDYLHEGNYEGLCSYDFTKEQKLAVINTCKSRGKSIVCINNGQVFESATDCARQSEKVFGIKLTQSCISQVCVGNQNNTKDYIFRFVEES